MFQSMLLNNREIFLATLRNGKFYKTEKKKKRAV